MPAPATPNRVVEALIIDLFGVVIAFNDEWVAERLAQHCTHPPAAQLAMHDLVSQPELIRGRCTLEGLREQLVAAHGLALGGAEFRDLWRQPYTAPMPGMGALLKELSGACRLVLLSNVDRDYWQVVQALHPELACFDRLLLSWEQGVAKPDPEAFRRAIEAAGSDAARCFFIDDKSENIQAAQRLGLAGHLFGGEAGLRQVLSGFGLVRASAS